MTRSHLITAATLFAFASTAVGCSKNSTPSTPVSVGSSADQTIPVTSTGESTTVVAGAYSALVAVPGASSGSGVLTILGETNLPASDPSLSLHRVGARTADDVTPGITPLAYLVFTSNATDSFASLPTFTWTLPSSVSTSGETFYLATYAAGAGGWVEPALAAGTVSGQTVTFDPTTVSSSVALPLTISPSSPFQVALYEVASAVSASPSATPTTVSTAVASASASPVATALASASPTAVATATAAVTLAPSPSASPTAVASAAATATAAPCVASGAGPAVCTLSPTSGAVGDTLTIGGAGFTSPIAITFTGGAQASGSFTYSQITVTVPAGAESGPITITTASGSAQTPAFTLIASPATAAPTASPVPSAAPSAATSGGGTGANPI